MMVLLSAMLGRGSHCDFNCRIREQRRTRIPERQRAQALPTDLASTLSPIDAELDAGGESKRGRQTSHSFEQAHLISLPRALCSSNKSFRTKSFVFAYPTSVLAS